MKQLCEQCGRGAIRVIKRSHSKRATISRQKVNLQKKTLEGKRILICTRCIKNSAKG